MIVTTPAWNTANAKMAKMPIYAMQISAAPGVTNPALPIVYTTHDLTRNSISGAPAFSPWLKTPTGASQTVDVVNGTSSFGTLDCEVVEQGGTVRAAVTATLPLEGSTVTLLVGYPGTAWSDFAVLHTYVLRMVVPSPDYTSYLFTSDDAQWQLKQTIYTHPENGELLTTDNPWYLCGTPAEIVQAIALFGLGLEASFIDRAKLAQLDAPSEGLYSMARPFQFALTESFQAQQFIEQEVLKPSLLYPVVTNLGAYSLKAPRPFAAGPMPVFAFTADNMMILPGYDRMDIYNQAAWSVDYDGNDYQQYATYVDGTSLSIWPNGSQFSIESKGLHSELGAFWYTQWVSDLLFRRFSGTPRGLRGGAVVLNISAFLMTLPVWLGDYVTLQVPQAPDMVGGGLGASRIYEVIDRQPDYANGKMQYKLLDTGLSNQAAAGTWGAFVIGTTPVY